MPVLFDIVPSAVDERLSFQTDVRSAPGGERRDSFRDAMQSLVFRFASTPRTAFQIEARFRSNVLGEWYVPVYPEMSRLAAPLSIGATSITVQPGDYRAGGKAVIIGAAASEILDVVSYAGTTLTVDATTAAHSAGAIVAPLATCVTPEALSVSISYALEVIELGFLRTDNADLALNSYAEIENLPVLTDPSVVVSPLNGSVSRALELIDSAFGAVAITEREEYTRKRAAISFVDRDREVRWSRKRFMHYLRGRDHPFWLPSWRRDLVIAASTTPSTTEVQFEAFGLPADHAALVGAYLEISEGANVARREILSKSEATGVVRYVLASAVGAAFTAAARVSVLRKMRLDTDEIELINEYVGGTDYITRINLNAVEVLA